MEKGLKEAQILNFLIFGRYSSLHQKSLALSPSLVKISFGLVKLHKICLSKSNNSSKMLFGLKFVKMFLAQTGIQNSWFSSNDPLLFVIITANFLYQLLFLSPYHFAAVISCFTRCSPFLSQFTNEICQSFHF